MKPSVNLVANLQWNNSEEFKNQLDTIVGLAESLNAEIEKLQEMKHGLIVSIVSCKTHGKEDVK